jgi:hypothetical protein
MPITMIIPINETTLSVVRVMKQRRKNSAQRQYRACH